ncbi:MAG: DUF4118 domain-containing protein, partial [Erysipelotrichaceae bacterium]
MGGHLKIFFGYAAGVGKTYAMLKQAHEVKQRGIDIVVGYVEPHQRPQTNELLAGLNSVTPLTIVYKDIACHEPDIDAIINMKPQVVLIDELAHSNVFGSRHKKRYQDINELLRNDIDVYTTLNVQHIESLNDMVQAITGVVVKETIPDFVFDDAFQVELVDIEPFELIERLNEGKIYQNKQVQKALSNFFNIKNLTALREISLRRCADRVNMMSDQMRQEEVNDFYTEENILVCLSSSPSNSKIIRTASRMSKAFKGQFTALFVETSSFPLMSESDKERLRKNIHLAQQLGASVEMVMGDDVAFQIAQFSRINGVSKIILGKSANRRGLFFTSNSLTSRLSELAPNLDIYIIPDKDISIYQHKRKLESLETGSHLVDVLNALGLLALATSIGFLFYYLEFFESNIIMIYILFVMIISVITNHKIYSLISSIISVLLFNYFFTVPRFTFLADDKSYPLTFLVMFLVAFLTSNLAIKLKKNARQEAQRAY